MRKYRIPVFVVLTVALLAIGAYAAATLFTGTIASIDDVAKSLVVGSTTVYTTDATIILKCGVVATFADLKVGQTVQVSAQELDGKLVATKICIKRVCDGTGPQGE